MRLFISYARVDKAYCQQIIHTLDVHDVWYDQRLHAGQKWWSEILNRLSWCDGFIYLLSPDSINSKYCQQEFEIAQKLNKHIFPVLIHARTPIPEVLEHFQYADLSRGLSVEAVTQLLNSVYVAERQAPAPTVILQEAKVEAPSPTDPQLLVNEAAEALDNAEFDRAVFLLKQARELGYSSRFINLDAVLKDAENALEEQGYLREAEREYQAILSLIKRQRTRAIGIEAFQEFRQHFPDYDPENIRGLYAASVLPMLEWCSVPEGNVTLSSGQKQVTHCIPTFQISKYPITHAQFEVFVEAFDGYRDSRWWSFASDARQWREAHPTPIIKPPTSNDPYPRGYICWYEAMAFCQWLSARSGLQISLPSEQQWQRAGQGDDERAYPWGDKFDSTLCNLRESKIGGPTPVTKYPDSASPFGVVDMIGNVWEWCLNPAVVTGNDGEKVCHYAVRGGAFFSTPDRSRLPLRFHLDPMTRYASIGFRVVCN
jgi:hypothetical protein